MNVYKYKTSKNNINENIKSVNTQMHNDTRKLTHFYSLLPASDDDGSFQVPVFYRMHCAGVCCLFSLD